MKQPVVAAAAAAGAMDQEAGMMLRACKTTQQPSFHIVGVLCGVTLRSQGSSWTGLWLLSPGFVHTFELGLTGLFIRAVFCNKVTLSLPCTPPL